MNVNVLEFGAPEELQPISGSFALHEIPVAGKSISNRLQEIFQSSVSRFTLTISPALWPSQALIDTICSNSSPLLISTTDGDQLAWTSMDGTPPDQAETICVDADSIVIKYPWHILEICEQIVGALKSDRIKGEIRENVIIDGHVEIGEGTVLLPGVYIEGNVIIGKNAKIGPNCYIRGKSYIGDGCHVGQAVEVKNSMLMEKVAAGHLSYIGDSIVCPKTNFGAGTIISNFRHDGKNHHSMICGKLVDTGRRKFGAIIGAGVHTGIHTSIYCGRKIWTGKSTLPGDIVRKDVM